MVARAYSGGWKARALYLDRPTPLGRPELSVLHRDPDTPQDGSRPPAAFPRVPPVPAAVEDPGTAYDPVPPGQAPGVHLDREPLTHDGPAGGGGQTLYEAQAAANAARSLDLGARLRQAHREPPGRAADETYSTPQLVVAPVSAGSRAATLRGANSLPENNPHGYRYGVRVQRWSNRKMGMRRRRHDLRPLAPMVAASAVESPAMGPDGSRYTSPYGWTTRSRKRRWSLPVQRRTPRPWDEDTTTDGVTEPFADGVADYQSWGL